MMPLPPSPSKRSPAAARTLTGKRSAANATTLGHRWKRMGFLIRGGSLLTVCNCVGIVVAILTRNGQVFSLLLECEKKSVIACCLRNSHETAGVETILLYSVPHYSA